MKFCPHCGTKLEEGAVSCPNCGAAFAAPVPVVVVDPADHTAEFDAADISENKVLAMLPYLMSFVGVIIALLAHSDSPYLKFHVRQSLKLLVCEVLIGLISGILAVTIIVPIAGVICELVLVVVQLICFVQVCKGEAKEPAIVSKLGFLK